MAHRVEHAAQLRGVLALDAVADASQPERAQRRELGGVGADARSLLGDAHGAHESVALDEGSASCASAAGVPSGSEADARSDPEAGAPSGPSPPSPSTWLTDSPRSSATCSGGRSSWRP